MKLPRDRAAIAALIPHQGGMCLLERVIFCDIEHICCATRTHRLADLPLRRDGRLAAVHLCEYGAQAAALHGALCAAQSDARPSHGLLVALRNVDLAEEFLDTASSPEELTVNATCRHVGAAGCMYGFEVLDGEHLLARGQATVAYGVSAGGPPAIDSRQAPRSESQLKE